MSWAPKRTLAECDAILCGPGMPHEMETRLVSGRVQRVYKNLWPSLRDFWLWAVNEFRHSTYIVFEDERYTYCEIFNRTLVTATNLQDVYGIQKGDRVAIGSRNLPDCLVAFWACHLLGAVVVLVNAWLPYEPLLHCLIHTGGKVVIFDAERADRMAPGVPRLKAAGVTGLLVFDAPDRKSRWAGMDVWQNVMEACTKDPQQILQGNPKILPEDHAIIIFTSGTTGLPKGVLSTQRQFLTNVRNATVAASRAHLRRGSDIPGKPDGPQRGLLVSVPFFHVTGSTSLSMLATSAGMKVVLIRKWNPVEAVRLIKEENIRIAGGVPSMVSDLVDSALDENSLDTLLFGGAPSPDHLPEKAKKVFPKTVLSQAYGMTETNSIAVGIAGEDYELRPTSTGLPCPVNDVLIIHNGVVVGPGEIGEVLLRGPDVMEEYWKDPDATAKAITHDGWIRTGDLGLRDEEGFLYIQDRLKDMIIRGGENIASVMVENALYHDERIAEAAAVGVPDAKLGELVVAVVSTKPMFHGKVMELELLQLARQRLPYFAVPVMIIVQDTPFELTPSAKIIKAPLRALAKAEWACRKAKLPGYATKL